MGSLLLSWNLHVGLYNVSWYLVVIKRLFAMEYFVLTGICINIKK